MIEEVLNSQRIAQFAIEEARKGNPILLDVSTVHSTEYNSCTEFATQTATSSADGGPGASP